MEGYYIIQFIKKQGCTHKNIDHVQVGRGSNSVWITFGGNFDSPRYRQIDGPTDRQQFNLSRMYATKYATKNATS